MMNTLENIDATSIGSLAEFGSGPFWEQPDFGNDPYFGPPTLKLSPETGALFISGPSRNGNHLIHSMLDGHPQICSLPGEDSFLAAFFHDLCLNMEEAVSNLRGPKNVDYILHLTGWGMNKWKELWELDQSDDGGGNLLWAGTQPEGKGYVTDYQDTTVEVDYPAYLARLKELAPEIRRSSTFMDVFWLYLDAMCCLNKDPERKKIEYLWVGSGMRAEMSFVFARTERVKCVAPLRPFETFYYSFAKGRRQTTEVRPDILQEAWEHWWHKTVDYLLLKKKYADRMCLVNFNHVLEQPEATAKEICRFLNVDFSTTCLIPTTLGKPTKGNSSFPKNEDMRGTFYKTGMEKKLHPRYWSEKYVPLWDLVQKVSI